MSKEKPSTNSKESQVRKPAVQDAGPQGGVAEADYVDLAQVQRAADDPQTASPKAMKGVQRAYGNQYVQRLAGQGRGGKRGRQPIQTKLTVNEPDDVYEQEAERVAEALPTNSVATSPSDNGNGDQPRAGNGQSTAVDSGSAAHPNPPSKIQNAPAAAPSQNMPNLEQEVEAVAEAGAQTPTAVPPVGGDEGGGGDNGGNKGVQRAATINPNGLTPTAQADAAVVRRGVPNQLHGGLFRQTQGAGLEELGDETAAQETAEMGYVPPVGGGGDDTPPTGAQRSAVAGYDTEGTVQDPVESAIDSKRGGGQTLPSPVQRQMESHLGSDFSGVRVHTDGQSDQLNRSLNAEAFTTGNDVFFRQGAYEPGSTGGQKLLAHELTHVVQQGAAPVSRRTQRRAQQDKNTAESTQQAEVTVAQRVVQRVSGQRAMRSMPTITHQLNHSQLQLKSKEEKAREEAQEKADEGKSEAGQAKASKQGDKDGIPDPSKNSIDEKEKKGKTHKFQDKKPAALETKGPVSEANLEFAEPSGDTGGIGWPDTRAEILPDWDTEVQKYDDFKAGDFDSMGLDLSGLKGDTTGIKVTDPAIREQMVIDALAQGLGGDGDFLSPRVESIGDVMDMIPFGGENVAAEKLFSEGPGAWFGEVKDQIGESFSDIGNSFGGIFEEGASGWARAASAMELIISVLELVKKVLKILNVIFYVVEIVTKILKALAKLPFVGYLFKWAVPIYQKVAAVFNPITMTIMMLDNNIKVFRTLATAFLIIDMLYYESDPEKLMDRQARLTQHAQGMRSMSQDKVKKGISDKYKDERKAEDMLVGSENLEDPNISPFTVEPPGKMEDGDKADYKQKFLNQYGVPDVADLAYNTLMEKSAALPPPPLVEYGAPADQDVRTRIDQNAIAIVHLRKQRAGLSNQIQQVEQGQEVASGEKKMFQQVDQTVQDNKTAMAPHKADMEEKLAKQAELKGDTSQTKEQGKESKETGLNVKGFAGIIVGFIKFFMGPIQKVGEKTDEEQQQTLASGPDQQVETSSASIDASQKGMQEADERTAETKQTQEEAKKAEGELDETSTFLGEQQAEAQMGIEKLDEEKTGMQEDTDALAAEEARLTDERTDLINQAVDWMDQWRMTREAIFTEIEMALGKHYDDAAKEKGEEDEGDGALNDMKTDVYDREKDMGDMEGTYTTENMDGDEADVDEDSGVGLDE